jgi:hypothetical protein
MAYFPEKIFSSSPGGVALASLTDVDIAGLGDGYGLVYDATTSLWKVVNIDNAGLPYVMDGGGAVLTTGEKAGFIRVPFTGFIRGWTLVGDPAHTGSIVVDTWIASGIPTVADTIWGGSKPTLVSANSNSATGLAIAVTAGHLMRHKVDSAATLWEATLNYHLTRT